MKITPPISIRLRVDRLLQCYDPWAMLLVRKPALKTLLKKSRQMRHEPHYDSDVQTKYDLSRILHFYLCFKRRTKVDPIGVSIMRAGDNIHVVHITDGHHRLCGADMAHSRTIRVSYRGPAEVLNYLTGAASTIPRLMSTKGRPLENTTRPARWQRSRAHGLAEGQDK